MGQTPSKVKSHCKVKCGPTSIMGEHDLELEYPNNNPYMGNNMLVPSYSNCGYYNPQMNYNPNNYAYAHRHTDYVRNLQTYESAVVRNGRIAETDEYICYY